MSAQGGSGLAETPQGGTGAASLTDPSGRHPTFPLGSAQARPRLGGVCWACAGSGPAVSVPPPRPSRSSPPNTPRPRGFPSRGPSGLTFALTPAPAPGAQRPQGRALARSGVPAEGPPEPCGGTAASPEVNEEAGRCGRHLGFRSSRLPRTQMLRLD